MVLTNLIPNFNGIMSFYDTQERFEGGGGYQPFSKGFIIAIFILAVYLTYPYYQYFGDEVSPISGFFLFWLYLAFKIYNNFIL